MDKFFKFLNSDRYQYTESEIYLKNNMQNQTAVFDVFLRTEKENDYAVVYGISDVLELIDILNNTSYEDRKKYLSEIFDDNDFIEYIANIKFTGSIKGVRDGEIVFSNEPVLTITAPLIQGKILETPILNILNYQILTATVTSKIVQAAENKGVLFFGTRRAAGFEASMAMTKAAYIAGCISHSNIMGEYFQNLKSTGTMTHGFIQSFGMEKNSEYKAFDMFIKKYKNEKQPLIMLVDTYNTLKSGILNAVNAFKNNNINDEYKGTYGIRIDSGNLEELSKKCRRILNENGFYNAKIILTGSLNEKKIRKLIENGAEVDTFGVGDSIALPEKEISTVYKMSVINGNDVMKISDDKQKMSLPGDKKIYRVHGNNDFSDIIMLEKEQYKGKETGQKFLINEDNILEREQYKREEQSKKGNNIRKLTVDYIIDGEKNEENCRLLELGETKKYYDSNLSYLKKIYNEKEKIKRVKLSEKLKELKNNLLSVINVKK